MPYDIHIEGVEISEIKGAQFLTFGPYPTPWGVKGLQKMVDRYVKCLCTPKGTDISDRNYGTQLLSLFLGNIDPRSVMQLIELAVVDAESIIREYDVDNGANDEERLASVTLERVAPDVDGTGYILTILLKNVAGTTVRVMVPDFSRYVPTALGTR